MTFPVTESDLWSVYPRATHCWRLVSTDADRVEVYECDRCSARKFIYNDVNVQVYDAAGREASMVECEYYGIANVMEE